MIDGREPILKVTGLRKEFQVRHAGGSKTLTAVQHMEVELYAGETVALVGESGSGKSTVARCIARLIEPTSGEVVLADQPLARVHGRALSKVYRDLQMVFQDTHGSLNPRMTVRATIEEPLKLHFHLGRKERSERVSKLLQEVDLSPELLDRYPRQLSGGQRQRVGIARAFAVDPKVVLLDEPTASLDVSIRGQVLDLLRRIQEDRNVAYLLISHDLSLVRKVAERVLVMYLGGVVEEGKTTEVFARPTHPYTRALLSSAPLVEYGRVKNRLQLVGEIPSAIDLPSGCRLASRCPLVQESCRSAAPELEALTPTHLVACPVVLAGGGAVGAMNGSSAVGS
jgi:peptide/nickel transport system ATP-binding protein/oligopeptide transport system ATP-binding protein